MNILTVLKRPKQPAVEIRTFTAPVIEWNHERGFGFLQHGSEKVFLHIRDLSRRAAPNVGDVIRFKLGLDAQGRTCAVEAARQTDYPRLAIGAFILLPLLLILPCLALRRLSPDPKYLFGYLAGISLLTWIAYYFDKRRARSGGWRVPESQLHLLEFLGGWPAAFLAQRCLRHKVSKRAYQLIFWSIVLLHQYAALDSLQNWKFASAAVSFAQSLTQRQ